MSAPSVRVSRQMSTLLKKLPTPSFAESHNFSAVAMPLLVSKPSFVAPVAAKRPFSKKWQGAESHSDEILHAPMTKQATDVAGHLRPRNFGGRYWLGTESHNAASFERPIESIFRR